MYDGNNETPLRTSESPFSVLGVLILLALIVGFGVYGCPNEGRAREILQADGYRDIEITGGGHGWSCGQNETATGFRARRDDRSDVVEGAVCCGMVSFKACTVRIERARPGRP